MLYTKMFKQIRSRYLCHNIVYLCAIFFSELITHVQELFSKYEFESNLGNKYFSKYKRNFYALKILK
jgi:hypothetical protein